MPEIEGNTEANSLKSNSPEDLRNGTEQAGTPKTPYEKYIDALRGLVEANSNFKLARNRIFWNPGNYDEVFIETFDSKKLEGVGYKGTQARVVLGQELSARFGNQNPVDKFDEISFYAYFGEDALRIQFDGEGSMFLNYDGNRINIDSDNRIRDRMVKGRLIRRVTREGVVLQYPRSDFTASELARYNRELADYNAKLSSRETRKGKLLLLASKIAGRYQQLRIPEVPAILLDETVPHAGLIDMIQKFTKGLQIAVITIEELEDSKGIKR